MIEQQTAGINSHKDIESLVEGWEGFMLHESFCSESGLCTMGGVDMRGRKSLSEPHELSGQIYRFLTGDYAEDNHRYALVTEEGKVILSVGFDFSGRFCSDRDILEFVQKYALLKTLLDKAGVDYTSNDGFEGSMIRAGRVFGG